MPMRAPQNLHFMLAIRAETPEGSSLGLTATVQPAGVLPHRVLYLLCNQRVYKE